MIRPIQQTDNAQLAFIIRSVLEEFNANMQGTAYDDPSTGDLYTLFREKNSAYFVAEQNNIIVGGAGVFPTKGLLPGCCELVKIYLLPGARGTGLGKKLMESCFCIAREMGFQQIYLETLVELNIAVGLYKKMGFNYLKERLGNSGHFACNIWMLKNLEPE